MADIVNNKNIVELASPEEKLAAFQHILGLSREGASHRISQSNRNRKFWDGMHKMVKDGDNWIIPEVDSRNDWRSQIAGPDTYQSIAELLPILEDNKPKLEVTAEDDLPIDLSLPDEFGEMQTSYSDMPSMDAADALNTILEDLHKRRGLDVLDSNILLESLISGIAYVTWSLIQKRGQPMQVIPHLLTPDQFLGDPRGKNVWDFSDHRWVIIEQMMTAADIERAYPGVKETDYASQSENSRPDTSSIGIVGRWFKRKSTADEEIAEYGLKEYPVHTLWYDHYLPLVGFGDIREQDKVPPMRRMVFINESYYAADYDIENPYWHQEVPIVAAQSAPRPFEAWGTSEVSLLMATQLAIDTALETMMDVMDYNANPGYDIDSGSIGRHNIDLAPGAVNEFEQDAVSRGAVRERSHRDISASIAIAQLFMGRKKELGHDGAGILGGQSPANIRSGKHANALLSSIMSVHGHRVKMLDPFWIRKKRMEVSYFQQFEANGYRIPSNLKDIVGEYDNINASFRELRYDIDYESQSNLPADLATKFELFLALYDRGMIFLKDFYDQTGIVLDPKTMEAVKKEYEANVRDPKFGISPSDLAALELQANQNINTLVTEQP